MVTKPTSIRRVRFRRSMFGKMVLQTSDHIGAGNVPQEPNEISWHDATQDEAAACEMKLIDYLGDLQRLSLLPGDYLVLSIDHDLSDDVVASLKQRLREATDGRHKVLVLGSGMKLGVLGSDA